MSQPTGKGKDADTTNSSDDWIVTRTQSYFTVGFENVVDVNKGAVDKLLGYDFVIPNATLNLGRTQVMDRDSANSFTDLIYKGFRIPEEQTDDNNLARSTVLISILNKLADDGSSNRATYTGDITINTVVDGNKTTLSVTFNELVAPLQKQKLLRKWARYHGQLFYEYHKYQRTNMEFNWGIKHGIKKQHGFLGADFHSPHYMTDNEADIYAAAAKDAKKKASKEKLLRSSTATYNNNFRDEDEED